jgi:hypothetical protein
MTADKPQLRARSNKCNNDERLTTISGHYNRLIPTHGMAVSAFTFQLCDLPPLLRLLILEAVLTLLRSLPMH